MKNNLRFIKFLFKMKLQRQMMYPLSFPDVTIVDGTVFLLWLLMFFKNTNRTLMRATMKK